MGFPGKTWDLGVEIRDFEVAYGISMYDTGVRGKTRDLEKINMGFRGKNMGFRGKNGISRYNKGFRGEIRDLEVTYGV